MRFIENFGKFEDGTPKRSLKQDQRSSRLKMKPPETFVSGGFVLIAVLFHLYVFVRGYSEVAKVPASSQAQMNRL